MHRSYRTRSGLSDWGKQVLDCRVYAVLSTVNPDGSTHTAPVGYAFDGERFLIQSGSGTRKVRNVEADPRVRVLVQAPPATVGQEGWVAADGSAAIVRGDEAERLNAIANGRYLTESGKAAYDDVIAPVMDVTVVVTPQRWHTWNDAMMVEAFPEHGYTEEEIATWWLPVDT